MGGHNEGRPGAKVTPAGGGKKLKKGTSFADVAPPMDPLVKAAAVATIAWFVANVVMWPLVEGWDYMASFYFAWVTLTTVGYGDWYPVTPAGQALGVLNAFIGIAVVATAFGLLTSYLDDVAEAAAKALNEEACKTEEERAAEDAAARKKPLLTKPQLAVVEVLGCMLVGCTYLTIWGGYDFSVAFYMAGITVVTAGYGDMSPMDVLSGNHTRHCGPDGADAGSDGCVALGLVNGTYVDVGVAVCKENPIDPAWKTQCYCNFLFSIVWVVFSVLTTAGAIGSVTNMIMDAKRKKKREKILNKKLTIDDLKAADDDNSGTVTLAEFVLFKLEMMEVVEPAMLKTIINQFKRIDEDGSGALTHADIAAAIASGKL